MTHEDYVSFEQAVKLKELGFDWECRAFYYVDTKEVRGNISPDDHNYRSVIVASAPTLAQAQKWLREVKEIDITPIPTQPYGVKKYRWALDGWSPKRQGWDENLYDTYELALSAGIDKAFQYLKQEHNGK